MSSQLAIDWFDLYEFPSEEQQMIFISSLYYKQNPEKCIDQFLYYYSLSPLLLHEIMKDATNYQRDRIKNHPSYIDFSSLLLSKIIS